MEAVGIHAHDRYKTGRRPPKNAPALKLEEVLSGVTPQHPVAADHFLKLAFGLYANDRFGVCGPTGVANLVRMLTGALLGTEIQPSQEDVFTLYRHSGNPHFDPATGADDNGVDMQTMLEALLKFGIGDGQGGVLKPIAFAKVDVTNDAELQAAASIFGALWGVNLLTAQQAQTDAQPPVWDYVSSPEWGGHCVLNGAYEANDYEDVISWMIRVATAPKFRLQQLEECWVVIWPWLLDHPSFQEGIDVAALAAAFKAITGKALPLPTPAPPPTPAPAPAPAGDPDAELWAIAGPWAAKRHEGETHRVAKQLEAWAAAKGLD